MNRLPCGWLRRSIRRPLLLMAAATLLPIAACRPAGTEAPETPRWELVEISRFGSPDGEDALLLSRLRDLVRSEGAVYVADALPGGTGRVLAIDDEGEPLGEIGRVGQGPGER